MISLARIARQIEREGRRWRLSPIIQGRTVAVVEHVPQIPPHLSSTSLVIPVRQPVVVLRLDENASLDAWTQVLSRRYNRAHVDLMKAVRQRQRNEMAKAILAKEQREADARRHWRAKFINSRTLFGPGIMPREPGILRGG